MLRSEAPNAIGEAYETRAEVYEVMGNAAASRADLERAVKSNRGNVQFNDALAWLLATSSDGAVRDGQLAVRSAKAANTLSGARDPEIIDTLAAAEAGDYNLAVQYERQALALAKGKKMHGAEKRLHLFENHQALRHDAIHENPISE